MTFSFQKKSSIELLEQLRAELGEPEAVYQLHFRRLLWIALGTGALLLGAFVLGALTRLGIVQGGVAAVLGNILAKFILVLLVGGIVGLVGLVRAGLKGKLTVLIFPSGLAQLCGGKLLSFPWSEITTVRLVGLKRPLDVIPHDPQEPPQPVYVAFDETDSKLGSGHWLELVRIDQTQVKFGAILDGFPDLVRNVQQRTFPHMWERLQEQWQQGGVVPWGPLVVTAAGIWHNDELLPWAEFGGCSLSRAYLKLLRRPHNQQNKGKADVWLKIESDELPNLHVMLAWLAHRQVFGSRTYRQALEV